MFFCCHSPTVTADGKFSLIRSISQSEDSV